MSYPHWLLAILPPLTIPDRPPPPLETFMLFPELAPEIREMIWTFAALSPRKVNLVSTCPDRYQRPRFAIEGQSRQPGVMEANTESRVVGKTFYELIHSVPKDGCALRGETACRRCLYDAWNADKARRYPWKMWVADYLVMIPGGHRWEVKDGFACLPLHEPVFNMHRDCHWINFERDVFTVEALPVEQYLSNFEMFVKEKVQRIEVCTVADMSEMHQLRWVLGDLLPLSQLQTVKIWLHWEDENTNSIDTKTFGEVGLELKRKSMHPAFRSFLGKGLTKEVRAKICIEDVARQ